MSADLSRPLGGQKGKRFLLQLPTDVLTHLDACAKANYRSRTAEILMRLEASMANESIDEHGVIVVQAPSSLK